MFILPTKYQSDKTEHLTELADQGDIEAKAELLVRFLGVTGRFPIGVVPIGVDIPIPISLKNVNFKQLCGELLELGKYSFLSHLALTKIALSDEEYSKAESHLRKALGNHQSIGPLNSDSYLSFGNPLFSLVERRDPLQYRTLFKLVLNLIEKLANSLLRENSAQAATWFAILFTMTIPHFISFNFKAQLNNFFDQAQSIDSQTRLALCLCISLVLMEKENLAKSQIKEKLSGVLETLTSLIPFSMDPRSNVGLGFEAFRLIFLPEIYSVKGLSHPPMDFSWIKEELDITSEEFTYCVEKNPWSLMRYAVRLAPRSCLLFLNSLYLSHVIDLKTFEDVCNRYFINAIPSDNPGIGVEPSQLEGDLPQAVRDTALHDEALCQLVSYLYETNPERARHYCNQISSDCNDETFGTLLEICHEESRIDLVLELYRKFKVDFVARLTRTFSNPEERWEKCIFVLTVAKKMASPWLFEIFLDYRKISASLVPEIAVSTTTGPTSSNEVPKFHLISDYDKPEFLVEHAILTCSYLCQEQTITPKASSPLSQLMNMRYTFFDSDAIPETPIQRCFENLKNIFRRTITTNNYESVFQRFTLSTKQCWQDFVTKNYDAKTSSDVCSRFLAIRNILERVGAELDVHFNISEIGILTTNLQVQNGLQV